LIVQIGIEIKKMDFGQFLSRYSGVEPYVHHSKMVLIDYSSPHKHRYGESVYSLLLFLCLRWEPNGSASFPLKTVPDKK
jgi:hypothetical protein